MGAASNGRRRQRPVLLVPGTGGFAYPYWSAMSRYLIDDDFHVYVKNFPWFNLVDVKLSAAKVARKAEFVLEDSGAEEIDAVGHSLGGIILRYYVERLGGDKVVKNLVTLGTPHHGTLATAAMWPFAAMRQIFYGAPFLQDLNRSFKQTGTRYTSIYSATDEACLPFWSCHFPGAENKMLWVCGHLGFLLHPKVYRWVRETLRGEPPRERVAPAAGCAGS